MHPTIELKNGATGDYSKKASGSALAIFFFWWGSGMAEGCKRTGVPFPLPRFLVFPNPRLLHGFVWGGLQRLMTKRDVRTLDGMEAGLPAGLRPACVCGGGAGLAG